MKTYTKVPELKLADYVTGDAAAKAKFSDALFEGFKYFGFIILRDHGISDDLLAQAYRTSEDFFAQDVATKRGYIGEAGQRGYTAFGSEHAKGNPAPDLKEFWHVGREIAPADMAVSYPDNFWPDKPANFKPVFSDLYQALDQTGQIMLEALTPKLGVPATYFRDLAEGGNSILRLLHYPPLAPGADPKSIRAAAHEDINLITLLVAASSSGLELLDRDGTWLPVEGSPNAVIVDAGDMLARITNNLIPATTHRVVNPQIDGGGPNTSRYSMPFFLHPRSDRTLACIESCKDGSQQPDINADEFLHQRLVDIGLKK